MSDSEDDRISRRKRPRDTSPEADNETMVNRVQYLENAVRMLMEDKIPPDLCNILISKRTKFASESPNKRSPRINKSITTPSQEESKEVEQQKNDTIKSSNVNSPAASGSSLENKIKKGLQYDCKLCERLFNTKQSRNTHYVKTHAVENEKLLFFPDGTSLVESSLEHHVSRKPDFLKAAAKRNVSSRTCKLCRKVDLDYDELKWHYETMHKVIQICKVKPIICLNNSDIKTVAEPFRCGECPRTFDDVSRLKSHILSSHGGTVECKFCKKNIKRIFYNTHVKKEHANMYFKKMGVTGKETKILRFKCRCCPLRFRTLVALRNHRRAVHRKTSTLENETKEKANRNSGISKPGENENEREIRSNTNSALAILMYLCDACGLATTRYDEAVAHCQDHILNNVTTETASCEICNLKFGDDDYQTHMQMHVIDDDIDVDSFRLVTYDYKLLMTDKWLDIFHFLPKFRVKVIESASVYFSTRCVRLQLESDKKEASAPFTLFQCVVCRKFVDPYSIISHVKGQNCFDQPGFPCEMCQIQFYNETARIQHNLTHKVPNAISKYRIVLFNDQSDFEMNRLLLEVAEKGMQAEKETSNNISEENKTKNVVTKAPETVEKNNISVDDKTRNVRKANEKNEATVYKCQCKLCFNKLKCLFEHLETCTNTLGSEIVECKCGLIFDKQNYSYHCKVNCNVLTTIHVKEIIVREQKKIGTDGIIPPELNSTKPTLDIGAGLEHKNTGNSDTNKGNSNINKANSESPQLPTHLRQDNGNQHSSGQKVGSQKECLVKNIDNLDQVIKMYNHLRDTFKVAQSQVSQEKTKLTDDKECDDENTTKENRPLVEDAMESDLKEAGNIDNQKKDSTKTVDKQVFDLTFDDQESSKEKDQEAHSLSSCHIRDPGIKEESQKYSTSCTSRRFSREMRPDTLRYSFTTEETNIFNRVGLVEHDKELKGPFTAPYATNETIDLLLTDDED